MSTVMLAFIAIRRLSVARKMAATHESAYRAKTRVCIKSSRWRVHSLYVMKAELSKLFIVPRIRRDSFRKMPMFSWSDSSSLNSVSGILCVYSTEFLAIQAYVHLCAFIFLSLCQPHCQLIKLDEHPWSVSNTCIGIYIYTYIYIHTYIYMYVADMPQGSSVGCDQCI